MRNCELCKVPARTFCESDQASLCWDCDAKVHGANFLVARHSRTLLCDACRSPTPWKATGARLGNTVSVCERCATGTTGEEAEESEGDNDDDVDTEDDDDFSGGEDGDNQVVPWSLTSPPPAASSSSSECSSASWCNDNGDGSVSEPVTTATSLKRQREDDASDRDLQEGSNSSASQRRCGGEWREEVVSGGEPPSKEWPRPHGRASAGI
ncbi:zinc finger protein CONSTANS-LIKE 9-like [Gastrolobium bilobum]|uniref:zinc finger protein CONSTANS-LIKE 9-like n=1 Tax=Gastrolobium bilobum TaxID=150636 RepID=UPI002AB31951|nr:zinc finger protein CONSTANS-LIKE 9-like [Gastrolobium bilobum]